MPVLIEVREHVVDVPSVRSVEAKDVIEPAWSRKSGEAAFDGRTDII
jgi:hypothetical protein